MKADKNRNIILVGYMGCGKSTVGRKAARALEYQFLDTDSVIEEEEGVSIAKLFEIKGETYFREKETELLRRLLSGPKGNIIATGGGLPMREENTALLKELGTVIYLKPTIDTLVTRLSGDKTRPLLQNVNIREKVETMLAVRGPVYEAVADVVLETDGMSFYQIICKIENLVKN